MNDKSTNENIDDDESYLDPRIEIKLEELNKWTGKINTLEGHFEQANGQFRNILSESTDRLKQLSNKLGKSINKSRPYYEARDQLIEIHSKCQRAAINYEKACESYLEAKERIKSAEKKFLSFKYQQNNNNYNSNHRPRHPDNHNHHQNHCCHDYNGEFDTTWQEKLNQANVKLIEAELMKRESEKVHSQSMKDFQSMKMIVLNLERKLARNLQRSKIYFDEKKRFQHQLALIKEDIELTVNQINCSKSRYASTLRELESISEEIHMKRKFRGEVRQTRTSPREPGDGAEDKSDKENQQQLQNRNIKYSQSDSIEKNLTLRLKDSSTSRIDVTSQKNLFCSCNNLKKKNSNSIISMEKKVPMEKQDIDFLAKVSQKWHLHYSDTFGPIYCNLVLK